MVYTYIEEGGRSKVPLATYVRVRSLNFKCDLQPLDILDILDLFWR